MAHKPESIDSGNNVDGPSTSFNWTHLSRTRGHLLVALLADDVAALDRFSHLLGCEKVAATLASWAFQTSRMRRRIVQSWNKSVQFKIIIYWEKLLLFMWRLRWWYSWSLSTICSTISSLVNPLDSSMSIPTSLARLIASIKEEHAFQMRTSWKKTTLK